MISACDLLRCRDRSSSLSCVGSSDRSMKRLPCVYESWERLWYPSPRSITCTPAGREIYNADLAQHVAQSGRDVSSSGLCRLPHLLMQLGVDDEKEVLHGTLYIVPVDLA